MGEDIGRRAMSELVRLVGAAGLENLATRINAEHRACDAAAGKAIEHAIRCGEMLLEAKGHREHGGWMLWLAANFEGSQDLANKYMRVARNSEPVINLTSEGSASPISLRGALEEIKTKDRRARSGSARACREYGKGAHAAARGWCRDTPL